MQEKKVPEGRGKGTCPITQLVDSLKEMVL